MADPFRFPVFFECLSLNEEQKKKIETYFQVRRKSGGGDCGAVTEISDGVYRIAFRKGEDQQRVLEIPVHKVKIGGDSVELIVQSTPPSSAKSMSPVQSFLLSEQSQPSSIASSLQTSVGELELDVDPYLLRYLKECQKANRQLERELTSVSCSAKIFPHEGKVECTRLAKPGSAYDFTTWKAELDKVFGGYAYHYECEPFKVKTLRQSWSSILTIDDLKVYSEIGMAVVVGKRHQVDAMLKDVEDLFNQQGRALVKRQNSIHRLRKAKLSLLWKEIEQTLGRDFPEVKVTRVDADQINLDGALEEVVKAGDLISTMEKSVLERTVSGVSPRLLAFLRKAYGKPGNLAAFLGVSHGVEIEVRDAELRMFTLSAAKLDDTEKEVHEKFKENTFLIPNCSTVPLELREMLKCKETEINRGGCRAQVVFGADNNLFLLGHTDEFEELSEVIQQFILNQAGVESRVILPFPDLAKELEKLLQLHNFDHSGVTIHHLTSSSEPVVVLTGPAGRVTEVRNRLGPFLDSVVQDRVTIDMPGSGRYLESPSGKESISNVARAQKCLIQLPEQLRSFRQDFASGVVATYSLPSGLKVLVCKGDITKQEADALVNAANERLQHGGGVAAALSKAGGPAVQQESSLLVKQRGKIPTGEAVCTTGGNLKCKVLLHAVGPVGGNTGGKERELLERTVKSTLDLAELMMLRSIAMPCISSGLFGVPITVCSEAIVNALNKFCRLEGRSLSRIILIDNREEVVRAMQEACDRLLQGFTVDERANDGEFQRSEPAQDGARGATAGIPGDGVHVEIIQGTIENQQVDVLVCPMSGHDPLSTRVGHILSNMVGPQLCQQFHQQAGGATLPGDTVYVKNLPGLRSGVIFLNLLPWDNNQNGPAVQALRRGMKGVLEHCSNQGSVALPVLGSGVVLKFPLNVASRVVLEEIKEFEQKRNSRTSLLIRIVIHPSSKKGSKAFQSAQEQVHLRGFTNNVNPDQASFYRHVSMTDAEVTAMLGGVKLQMVNGDITHETTNVIVNTTDFKDHSGVSKAILTAAGPNVQTELARVGVPPNYYCITGPGLLGCTEIIHACFMGKPDIIRDHCKKILQHCERKGYSSAAFPAINTGAARMDFVKACKAMLDGMTAAITDLKPSSLSLIRIVILEQPIFQAFRSELELRFGLTATPHLSLAEKAKQKLKKWQSRKKRIATASANQENQTFLSFKPPSAVLSVIHCGGPDTIQTIKKELEGSLQKQLVERELDVLDFSRLEPMELEAVQCKVRAFGISLEHQRRQRPEGLAGNRVGNAARAEARGREGSGEVYVLKGLKEDVLSVTELVNRVIKETLYEDLQEKEEAMLAIHVQWSIQEENGTWVEFSLHDNFLLEEAHTNKQVSTEITAPNGKTVTVNLRTEEATDWTTGTTYKVKRIKSGAALDLPVQWEPMGDDLFKKVELQPHSMEYQTVAQGFLRTARYNICKIERVQNVYLWKAFSVCRERILAKNGSAELGEMFLYHGTNAKACECIERDKFDRGFAGTHAAVHGKGVYFAVNANYSAGLFSPVDSMGLKRLYVARVLTGRYTKGESAYAAPPARALDPTDRYDSVVDNPQAPSMFVIFHDDQAYPEYLVTFK